MADTDDAWTCEANEALEISLITPTVFKPKQLNELQTLATFHPTFTYPIFGEDERIFGYQGLKIKLRFHTKDMRPNVQISQSKKYKAIGETEPTDILALLAPFLPQVGFERYKNYQLATQLYEPDWTPPGECLQELQSTDGTYEIWKGSLAEPPMQQMLNRLRILVPMFIEGGIPIDTENNEYLNRWTVFLLYRKRPAAEAELRPPSYDFAGFATAYRFFVFISPSTKSEDYDLPSGEFDLEELPCRSRISQFLILPPYQKKGLASLLYSAIYQHYLHHHQTYEITVEDPNEAFDDLRDLADLAFLRTKDAFNKLRIDPSIPVPKQGKVPMILDPAALEALRAEAKMSARQFNRVLEMHLMSRLHESLRPSFDDVRPKQKATPDQEKASNLWKLLVKQRLFRHNKDQLEQLEDRGERVQKLNETLGSVELEYARLLAAFENRKKLSASSTPEKRKAADDEDSAASRSSKKARMREAA